jgi:hypothetical protein
VVVFFPYYNEKANGRMYQRITAKINATANTSSKL